MWLSVSLTLQATYTFIVFSTVLRCWFLACIISVALLYKYRWPSLGGIGDSYSSTGESHGNFQIIYIIKKFPQSQSKLLCTTVTDNWIYWHWATAIKNDKNMWYSDIWGRETFHCLEQIHTPLKWAMILAKV